MPNFLSNSRGVNILIVLLSIWTIQCAQGQDSLSIFDIIELAHQQSTAFKQAATEKETNYWKYQYFKAGRTIAYIVHNLHGLLPGMLLKQLLFDVHVWNICLKYFILTSCK